MTGVDLQAEIEAKIEKNASSSAIWSARGDRNLLARGDSSVNLPYPPPSPGK